MINFEYLDVLYRWKTEAEIKLEELEEEKSNPLPMDEAEHIIEIRTLKINNIKEKINMISTAIRSYIEKHI